MTANLPEQALEQRWIRFSLGGQEYAVDIRRVREVMAQVVLEPVPGAPHAVLGVINLRGQIVTVIDLRQWLGMDTDRPWSRVLVLEKSGVMLGMAVDAVHDVVTIDPASIRPPPVGKTETIVEGLTNRDGHLLTLVTFDRLLVNEPH